jgi:hypothetical protein
MIGVKVGEEDCVDFVAPDLKFVHRDERACPAIDQNIGVTAGEV